MTPANAKPRWVEDSGSVESVSGFGFYDLITATGTGFQLRFIENLERTATVTNQVLFLENTCGFVNPFAPHSQHVRQKVLSEFELIRIHPIACHQKPSGEPRVDRVEPVADGGLRDLG